MFFVSDIGWRDDRFADAECVDASFQDGADGLDEVSLLFGDPEFLCFEIREFFRATATALECCDLFVDLAQLRLDFFLRNTEIKLRATDEVETEVQCRITHERRCPRFHAIGQRYDHEENCENCSEAVTKGGRRAIHGIRGNGRCYVPGVKVTYSPTLKSSAKISARIGEGISVIRMVSFTSVDSTRSLLTRRFRTK